LIRLVLKYISARSLDGYWSMHIEIRDEQRIIDTGVFRYMRHPGYLSTVFEMITIPLLLCSCYTLAWTCLGYGVLLSLRIMLEEKALRGACGQQYDRYRKDTDAIIPVQPVVAFLKQCCTRISRHHMIKERSYP
jgi:protein-S-isoprenylcysteine O-methyltransferase Ste14